MTAQPQTAAPTLAVPRTPVGALLRYLAVIGEWLGKNLKEALTVAVVGFVIGWVINFVLMAFFYDGFRTDETTAATGEGNVRNGMLIWSLFSSVAFGLIAYRRTVGKERFQNDLATFPGAIIDVFRKDGDAVWTHILWGAAVSLLATFLIARWAGLGVAALLAAAALSPLGLILAAMVTQLWRAIMRSLMPLKKRRAVGSAGLFVGLFTSSLVLLAGFFIANEKEKLILGVLCLIAAVVVGRRQLQPQTAAVLWLFAPIVWLMFPELGFADDGGFKEAGGDFGAWARGGGLGEISGYGIYGGVATAVGGLVGWMAGAVNGAPPPPGGWEAGLDGDPDPDPGDSPVGDGLPIVTSPVAAATSEPDPASEATGAAGEEPALDEPADPTEPSPDVPAPAAATVEEAAALAASTPPHGDDELTDDEIAAMSEEEYRAWRNRTAGGDPDSPAEILRRAMAGDPEAAARWEEIKGEDDPSFLDRVASVVLGPAYDAIGGSETVIELAKTDWVDESVDTAAALGTAAGRRIGQIADTAVETVSGAIDLAGMDASEVSGMFGAIGDGIANSTVGRIVSETVEGAVDLAGMDADELAGMVGQVRDDAADAVVERIDQARTLVEGMTVEEAIGHLNRTREAADEALTEAERAIRRQAQEVMRMNPDAVRDTLADGTIAVVEELVVEVASGGLGAARHADEVVDLARGLDNAADTARAADNATDAARAAEGGSDAARAAAPDAPPVRDAPDAPDAPATPDGARAVAAEPDAPSGPVAEGRRPAPAEGPRRDPDAPAVDAEVPPAEAAPTRAADSGGRTGPGDTVELDPADGPGGVRPPDASRPSTDAPTEVPADAPTGSPPTRSSEPWTEADTVRTPRRSAEAPGATDPGGGPARAAAPAGDAPDGDLVFEMEDGSRVNMTTNRPEPPRPGSPADLGARGDASAAAPRNEPGAAPDAPPGRPPDQPDGDLIFEMEDGSRVNMTTNRPEPPRPGSPADPSVRAETAVSPPDPPSRPASGDVPDPAAARTGPGGTQRLDPADLPPGRTGPGGTQRLDPADLPDARSGPGGTQRLDAETPSGGRSGPDGTQRLDPPDLPEGRTGQGGTQRLEAEDLPDGRRAAPVDRSPAGPGEEIRPGVRRAPDGTHQVRMSRAEAERILGDAEPGGVGRTAPTERMPPDAPDLEAARRENAQFRDGMERARRDVDGPGPRPDPDTPAPPAEAPTGRLADPDLPPDEATARARTRAEGMRDDMNTIRDTPLDEAPTPAPRDRTGPSTRRLNDPDLPPDEATARARTRAEGMRDDMNTIRDTPLDEAPTPGPRDRTGPSTRRLNDPDLPPDEATARARTRAEGMRDDMNTIGDTPLDDARTARLSDPDMPPAETPSGASRGGSRSGSPPARAEGAPDARGVDPADVDSGAETVAPSDPPPRGRSGRRAGPSPEAPAPDAPAAAERSKGARGAARNAPPATDAPEVPVIPGSEGKLLENQTLTARTVTGLDDAGRPIVHPHDEVTVPVGEHLKSGSFSDVFASTEGYFGSDPDNTLVRISKPISTEAGAQSLRADRVGREALAQVRDEIASPRVLGTFEIMDEAGGRRVMEVVENVTVGDNRGVRAAEVLRDRAMNVEEAMAYDRATRALNDRGYVSLDLHEGNFTLIEEADGARKLGVFDPGGIMPVRGNDPEVARMIQSRINAPEPEVLRVRPDFSARMIQEEVRELLLQHVDGDGLGINLNEFIFKPSMGRNHPLVRELFSADDPEALYRRLRDGADR